MTRLEWAKSAIKRWQQAIDFIEANREKFEALEVDPTPYESGRIDIDMPRREVAMAAIIAFPGKWNKVLNANEKDIDYELPLENGLSIRLWCTPPPPSCRLVEELVLVPETLVPEHYETKIKLICSNGTEAHDA